jgi:hypothetical protein
MLASCFATAALVGTHSEQTSPLRTRASHEIYQPGILNPAKLQVAQGPQQQPGGECLL